MKKISSLILTLLMISSVLAINNAGAVENIPILSISDEYRTVFWGFDGEINISVKNNDSSLTSLLNVSVKIFNDEDQDVTNHFNDVTIAKGYVLIKHQVWGINDTYWNGSNWITGDQSVFGENGTWRAYLSNNSDNASLMWNLSINFYVEEAPDVQFKWVDDDGVLSTSDTDGIIPEVPDFVNQSLIVKFKIVSKDHTFFDDAKNITLSGNALLLPRTLDEIPGVSYGADTWNVPLTPIMTLEGREIVFDVNWKDYGKITKTLNVGGSKHNGSIVSISPSSFVIDEDTTLTVTVTDSEGTPCKTASVWLYWLDDNGHLQGLINSTNGGGTLQGQYYFMFNKSQQTTGQLAVFGNIKSPRHIAAYVKLYQGIPEFVYGYAIAELLPKSDLQVTVSQPSIMAGQKTKFSINTTTIEGAYPQDIQVDIFDSNNKKINSDAFFTSITDSDLQGNNISLNDYIIPSGVYTIYAYNSTHGSSGHNTSLEVKSADITSDKTELIWRFDKNINVTFYAKYEGAPINGTLYIYNVSKVGQSYKTWVDSSVVSVNVINGIAILEDINVSDLPPVDSSVNIEFAFESDKSGSVVSPANGLLQVKVPTVTPTPGIISYKNPASIEVTASGRGVGLKGFYITLIIPGPSVPMNALTNDEGKASFSFVPTTTGEIIIKIENRTSSAKVLITAWSLYIDAPDFVDEGQTFTVIIRNMSFNGASIEEVIVNFAGETKSSGYTFLAPSVKSNVIYKIRASKEGYASDEKEIMLINVPKLSIIIDTKNYTINNKPYNIDFIIADDEGKSIIGANIEFNGKTYTSGINGYVEVTIPNQPGEYTINVGKEGFSSSAVIIGVEKITKKGIPGFEAIALIGAIGIAFILLRKKCKEPSK